MHPSDHPHYPITVQTCEDHNQNNRRRPLVPYDNQSPTLFRLDDPFGLRKAIVPIFHADDTDILTGMGTAFALDPWGNFLSADHVTDFLRHEVTEQSGEVTIPGGAHALALLGMGLVLGKVGIPREALIQMTNLRTPMILVDDPMNFTGRPKTHPYDVTFLSAATTPPERMLQNLPIRRHPTSPRVGELVVAVGYPEIELARGAAPSLPTSITEGMFAAYGIVSNLHPRGRDRANPTPVFEVEANWPSGMSGGPVFNAGGEVIGIVSRSLAPADGAPLGTAWATWLAASIPPTEPVSISWPESIDAGDLYFRSAWAAVRLNPWSLEGFPTSEQAATALATSLGNGFEARLVSQRLGTETYCVCS
nr:serine protease [Rhizobium sp. Q54]